MTLLLLSYLLLIIHLKRLSVLLTKDLLRLTNLSLFFIGVNGNWPMFLKSELSWY